MGPERPYLLSDWRHGVSSARFAAVRDKKRSSSPAPNRPMEVAIFRFALQVALRGCSGSAECSDLGAGLAPAPFSGVGATGPRRTGRFLDRPLTVNFPGAPHYPLTGPPFEASAGTTSAPSSPFF